MRRRDNYSSKSGLLGIIWVENIKKFYSLLVKKKERESLLDILIIKNPNWF